MAAATPSQSWAILARHARDEAGPLRLQELCTDSDRVSSLVAVHTRSEGAVERLAAGVSAEAGSLGAGGGGGGGPGGGASKRRSGAAAAQVATSADTSDHTNRILLVDLSRQRMTVDTINHLLRLASSRDVRGFIRTLAWGWNDRNDPVLPKRLQVSAAAAMGGAGVSGGSVGAGDHAAAHHANSPQHNLHRVGSRHARFAEDPVRENAGQQQQHPATAPNDPTSSSSHRPPDPAGGFGTIGGSSGPSVGALMRTSPSMHLALRVPSGPQSTNSKGGQLEMLLPDGTNALTAVHSMHSRIVHMSNSIRHGKLRGASGKVLKDVVVVGRGVAVAALQFMYDALRRDAEASRGTTEGLADSTGGGSDAGIGPRLGRSPVGGGSSTKAGGTNARRMRFVTSVDPAAASEAVSGLKPASTLVITLATLDSSETSQTTHTLQRWLLAGLGSNRKAELVIGKHMLLVTGNERLAKARSQGQGVGNSLHKAECIFLIPEMARCEAFTTFTAAGLLPLSIVFGWKIVQRILAGAHDLDTHFVETNPRHNLPVLLALADVWNDAFLKSSGRVVTPFSECFARYPALIAAMEAQTCGRGGGGPERGRGGRGGSGSSGPGYASAASAIVIDGGLCGAYDRVLYQGGRHVPAEMIMAMDTQAASPTVARTMGPDGAEDAMAAHDALICSFFAHADVLAFGSGGGREAVDGAGGGGANSPSLSLVGSRSFDSASHSPRSSDGGGFDAGGDIAEGNRPSTLLIVGTCDAFACGQLVALAEHRAAVAARLWDVDPFAFAPATGTALRARETERLKERLHQMYERIARGENDGEEEGENGGAASSHGTGTKLNLATSTILGHYANRMRDQKMYVVKGN